MPGQRRRRWSRARAVRARPSWCPSLDIFEQLGSPYWQGRARASLGRLYSQTGRAAEAAEAYTHALRLLEPIGAPEAAELADRLREAADRG